MGQPLTGTEVQATYNALLKTAGNTAFGTGVLNTITDGLGNETPLQLGIEQFKVSGDFVNIESPNGTSGILINPGAIPAYPADLNYYGTHDFSNATVTGLPGGGGGLVAGDGGSSMMSDGALTPFAPAEADGQSSIALGLGAKANRDNSIAIGPFAVAGTDNSIVIGQVSNSAPSTGTPYVAIVPYGIDMAYRDGSVVVGHDSYPANGGVAIGNNAKHTGGGFTKSVVIGNNVRANGNNDVTIGTNSSGLGPDQNKITIGANNNNYAEKSIIIGSGNDNADAARVKAIIIGNSVKAAQNAIVIGNDSSNYTAADSIQIGNGNHATYSNYAVNIGYGNSITGYTHEQIVIGKSNSSSAQRNIIIGSNNVGGQDGTIMIGEGHTTSATGRNHGIGYGTITTGLGEDKIAYGTLTKATADRAVAIGRGAEATHTYSVALGPGVTSKTVDTTHVQGLNVGSVNEYADNAAAVSAGLPIGQIYRTGDLLKIVHA